MAKTSVHRNRWSPCGSQGVTRKLPCGLALLCAVLLGAPAAAEDAQEEWAEEAAEPGDEEEVAGGAAASDPTASVNYEDFRFRWLDLGGDRDRSWYSLEGAYVWGPVKIIHELHLWDTDLSGSDESHLESFHLKGIYLRPIEVSGVKGRFALGAEWIKELGDFEKGTSAGSDQIAPLIGVGWTLTKRDLVITLAQHFHSYRRDSGAPRTRVLGPRLIWIRKFPAIKGWVKLDYKMLLDFEADRTSNTAEVQLGTMLTRRVGVYLDGLVGIDEPKQYKWGVGVGLRVMY